MNTSRKLLLAGVAAISTTAVASSAFAQASASASASASATIVKPITLSKVDDLAFGTVVSNVTNAGTAVIGVSSDTPTLTNLTTLGAASAKRAKFTLTGETGQAYTVTLPTGSVAMTGSASGVTLTGFTSNAPAIAAGSNDLFVGATLNVPANTGGGSYTGTFSVSVAYN